jgi:hypothetical protein
LLTDYLALKPQVFRCYDNRLRFMDRRPDTYLYSGLIEGVEKCIHLKDTKVPRAFGEQKVQDDDEHRNSAEYLWTFQGQLLIISTPYLQGKHCATAPLQLFALVLELEKLHQNAYVHGNIRGFNVIFQEGVDDECTETIDQEEKIAGVCLQGFRGCLIDFDFAGVRGADTTKYPKGYRSPLNDGFRLGNAGEAVAEVHEWQALHHILFYLHEMHPPIGTSEALDSGLPQR